MGDRFDAVRLALGRGPALRLAVVFGSVATGHSRATSDLDIAILPADPTITLMDEARLAGAIEEAWGASVDLVRLDLASTFLRWQIARDGQPLLSEPVSEWTRFRAVAASDHADFQEPFSRAAELFRRRIARLG